MTTITHPLTDLAAWRDYFVEAFDNMIAAGMMPGEALDTLDEQIDKAHRRGALPTHLYEILVDELA